MANTVAYSQLPPCEDLRAALKSVEAMPLVPDDWVMIITDIVNSTSHATAGAYKNVNLVSAACIVAALNALGRRDIPFIFGGDGALLACHEQDTATVAGALLGMKRLAAKTFSFDLRVGAYPAGELRRAGSPVRWTKLQATPDLTQVLFAGPGVVALETRLKSGDSGAAADHAPVDPVLDGLECRWNEVPAHHGTILTLLVEPLDPDSISTVFDLAEQCAGPVEQRHPLHPARMRLSLRPSLLAPELKLTKSHWSSAHRKLASWGQALLMAVGEFVLRRCRPVLNGVDWGAYFANFRKFSDSEKFCGMLSMVLSCEPEAADRLTAGLDELERAGRLRYGSHRSHAALLTCMVLDRDTRHYHFIDGAGGGYIRASSEWKRKRPV